MKSFNACAPTRVLLPVIMVLPFARPVAAQRAGPTVAVGMAVPRGPLGAERGAGPLGRIGLVFGASRAAVQFRIEAERAYMPARGAQTTSQSSSLTSTAVLGNVIVGPRGFTMPYLVVGGGIQWLRAGRLPSIYGATPGVRIGIGLRSRIGSTYPYVELLSHLNLTDFASAEWQAGHFLPVVAGVRF